MEDDIVAGSRADLERRFHAVRAANVLNRVYFDDATLRVTVSNLADRLLENGLLIVCRTVEEEDGANHGTVFKLDGSRQFQVIERLGRGSEIEQLLLPDGLSGDGLRPRPTAND